MHTPFNVQRQSRMDFAQLAAVLLLMLVSVAFVYSATMSSESTGVLAWYRQVYFRQIVWFGLGLGAAGAVCLVDYHTLSRLVFCRLLAHHSYPDGGADSGHWRHAQLGRAPLD